MTRRLHPPPLISRPPQRNSAAEDEGLTLTGVSMAFSGVHVLQDIDLRVHPGEILGLIGPNGAGKTTLVNIASGFQQPSAGDVLLDGVRLTGRSPHRFARAGISRTFQAVRPFGRLTVRENVYVAALTSNHARSRAMRWVDDLLQRFGLMEVAEASADALSYGHQRMLGVARALASRPTILMLDEPAAGFNEHEADELRHILAVIPQDFDCAMLVIEHQMPLILGLCDRIQVLDHGISIAVGTPSEVRDDEAVQEAYLGTGAHE